MLYAVGDYSEQTGVFINRNAYRVGLDPEYTLDPTSMHITIAL